MNTEFLNEITILTATEALLFYTNILDPDSQNNVAWISFAMFIL